MEIRQALDSDKDRWDAFVLNHPDACAYHLFAWKKAIELSYGHKCLYYFAEKNNQIKGILPITIMRLPMIMNQFVSLPYCDVGNCISDDDIVQDRLLSDAIHFENFCKAHSFQIRGDLHPTHLVQTNFQRVNTDKVRMMLDLPSTSDELLTQFKSKLRSQIRKSEKNGVVFKWGYDRDFESAYNVFSKNMLDLGSPVHSKFFLKAVLKQFASRAKLGIAIFNEKVIGMAIIVIGGGVVSIPWASTLREFNHLGTNMLIYWNCLKYSADNGFARFDFGRSSDEEGTFKFKKQWGAKPIPLHWYELDRKQNSKQKRANSNKQEREKLANIWRNLPLRVANMLGPPLRKYISL